MNALAFRSLGYKVHVLERSPPSALDSQAAGIRVGPEVHDFIKKYIPDYARDYNIMADAVEIVKDNGDVELKIPPKDPLRLTTWKSIYDMFLTCLLKEGSGTSATYQTGSSVQDVSLERGKVHVRYTTMNDGTNAEMEADLVIAADGAHSTIRHQLHPGVSPEYAGYVSWRGRVPESALSSSTREALQDRCVIHRVEGGYQIS
jgi:2-polyprenyl-6-methoxyphenol hydroxylase-like FAD-dependent oxidoreductase